MKCRFCSTAYGHFLCRECQERYLAVKEEAARALDERRQELQEQWERLVLQKNEKVQEMIAGNRKELLARKVKEIKRLVSRKEQQIRERKERNDKLRSMVTAGRVRQKHWQEQHHNISKSYQEGLQKMQEEKRQVQQQISRLAGGLEYRFKVLQSFVSYYQGNLSLKNLMKVVQFMSNTYLIELPYQVTLSNATLPESDTSVQHQTQANILYIFSRMNVQVHPQALTASNIAQFHNQFIRRLNNHHIAMASTPSSLPLASLHLDQIFASKPQSSCPPQQCPPEDEDEDFEIIQIQFLPMHHSSQKQEVLYDSDMDVEYLDEQN